MKSKRILTVSNVLSFLRAPLALFFLCDSPLIRLWAVAAAMLTDCLDGYLARRFKNESELGAILDPVMDRVFVIFAFAVLIHEGTLPMWAAALMLTRDITLALFAFYLRCCGLLKFSQVRATFWGKVTTFAQFLVLLTILWGFTLPHSIFVVFLGFSALLLRELFAYDLQRV